MVTWNLGSASNIVYSMIANVPSSVSGAVLLNIIDEVRGRGGSNISIGVVPENQIMIGIAEALGFKKSEKDSFKHLYNFELDLSKVKK